MISLDEINREIARLENMPTTLAVVERLSWLYIVRDHISPSSFRVEEPIPEGKSEFMTACRCGSVTVVMGVMDELMDTLQAIQPRLYSAVMRKLES